MPRIAFVVAALWLAGAVVVRATEDVTRVATPGDVADGVNFLAGACALDGRSKNLVEADFGEVMTDVTVSARSYVLCVFAAYDEWTTGLHYVTGAPHEQLPAAMAQCCRDRAVEAAAVIYDAEFAAAVEPWFDSWVAAQ